MSHRINTNKIFVSDFIELNDVSDPVNPGKGKGRLYKKKENIGIFWKSDSGEPEIDLTLSGGSLDFDIIESTTDSPPKQVNLTLDKIVTICNNNCRGFGRIWEVILPNGEIKGQEKLLSVPLSGNRNTNTTLFLGTFCRNYTKYSFSGSNQPRAVRFMWTGDMWFLIGGGGGRMS